MLPGAREIHGDRMSLPGFNGLPAMGCTQLGEDTINCPAENIIHKKATERVGADAGTAPRLERPLTGLCTTLSAGAITRGHTEYMVLDDGKDLSLPLFAFQRPSLHHSRTSPHHLSPSD